MPLKIVMLLGSEGIPKFFPKTLLEFDRNTLIISLVSLSITFYLVSVIFEKLSKKATESGAKRLIANTQKIIIFENQNLIASNTYTKYTEAIAGIIFALTTIILLSMFYIDVAVLTLIFLPLAYVVSRAIYVNNIELQNTIKSKLKAITNTISNIGFLLIFLYIVVDFMYLTPPAFIVALASIILGRMMLLRLSVTTTHLISLKLDERKINTLFFHRAFLSEDAKSHQSAWNLISGDKIKSWLDPVLKEATNQEFRDISIEWIQTRLKNIVVLKVDTDDKTFLIKIFEHRAQSQALHESTLLVASLDEYFPCPPLLLTTILSGFHSHVFDISGHLFLPHNQSITTYQQINEQLLAITPPDELTERYKRSKAFSWERADQKMIDRLNLVATNEEKKLLLKFEQALPFIKSILQSLPLSFVNNKPNQTSFLENSEHQFISYDWSSWSIEPTGFGVKPDNDTYISDAVENASVSRPELKQFPLEDYELAASFTAFQQTFEQDQYKDSIDHVRQILRIIDDRMSD